MTTSEPFPIFTKIILPIVALCVVYIVFFKVLRYIIEGDAAASFVAMWSGYILMGVIIVITLGPVLSITN
jgi:hypothetical protein